jgi:DNA-binding NarL/FixJ family response regulator
VSNLTRRQAEVVRRYARGDAPATIAEELGIRPDTVRHHACHARKTGAVVPRAVVMGAPQKVPHHLFVGPFRAGKSIGEIARQFGVCRSAVQRALKKMRQAGVELPPARDRR